MAADGPLLFEVNTDVITANKPIVSGAEIRATKVVKNGAPLEISNLDSAKFDYSETDPVVIARIERANLPACTASTHSQLRLVKDGSNYDIYVCLHRAFEGYLWRKLAFSTVQ